MNKNRQLGMLLGLHCGDSLGATLEFGPAAKAPSQVLKDIVGGGAFGWKAGQATDDTDLMICVLKSLMNNELNLGLLHQYMIAWYNSDPKDIGRTTKNAILKLMGQEGDGFKNISLSNGSLMRCAPLALLNQNESDLLNTIKIQHDISHAMEESLKADTLFIMSLQLLLAGKDKNFVYNKALTWSEENFKSFHARLKHINTTPWHLVPTSGFVLDTLFSAFWALMKTNTFEEGIILVANRGDDSDTCAAVAGALCGAHYGADNIPPRWLAVIKERETIENEVDRLISQSIIP